LVFHSHDHIGGGLAGTTLGAGLAAWLLVAEELGQRDVVGLVNVPAARYMAELEAKFDVRTT